MSNPEHNYMPINTLSAISSVVSAYINRVHELGDTPDGHRQAYAEVVEPCGPYWKGAFDRLTGN